MKLLVPVVRFHPLTTNIVTQVQRRSHEPNRVAPRRRFESFSHNKNKAGGSVGIEGSLISFQNVVRFHSVATKMLTYQWMLIPSMPVAVSLKRWFESNRQYGSVSSRVQLENGSGEHLKMSPQNVKLFIQFEGDKN